MLFLYVYWLFGGFMKKSLIFLVIFFIPVFALAQLKENSKLPSFSTVGTRPGSNLILGFLNPEKLSMHHSLSMGYMSMGSAGGIMINSYTNTIDYQISNPLFLRLNLGIMNSPYNSFQNQALNNTQFFGGAELFYRPTENSLIKIGFDMRPGYYGPGFYRSGFYNDELGW